MTTTDIIDAFCCGYTQQISGDKVFPNTYLNKHEADIFKVTKSGYLYEYEVKISRSDFFADAKKSYKKERILNGERCNYFYYLVPNGLILPEEIPEYAGLIYINDIRTLKFRKIGNYGDEPDWLLPILNQKEIKYAPKLTKELLGQIYLPKLMESTYRRFHYKTIWNKYENKKL